MGRVRLERVRSQRSLCAVAAGRGWQVADLYRRRRWAAARVGAAHATGRSVARPHDEHITAGERQGAPVLRCVDDLAAAWDEVYWLFAARLIGREARIYAEDPGRGYTPTTGPILTLHPPQGEGVRLDTAMHQGAFAEPPVPTAWTSATPRGRTRAARPAPGGGDSDHRAGGVGAAPRPPPPGTRGPPGSTRRPARGDGPRRRHQLLRPTHGVAHADPERPGLAAVDGRFAIAGAKAQAAEKYRRCRHGSLPVERRYCGCASRIDKAGLISITFH